MIDRAGYDWDVFISFSDADTDWVQSELLPHLRRARMGRKPLRVCVGAESLEVGAPRVTEIERAVQKSRKTVLVLTPDYLKSNWATFEDVMLTTLDVADHQWRLIPLVVKQCELPLRIAGLICVDLVGATDPERQFRKLLHAIGASEESLPEESYEQGRERAEPTTASGALILPEDGSEMILIPAGKFIIGSDSGNDDEMPQRELYLPGFYISRYPITNAQFQAFVQATGYTTEAERHGNGFVWKDKGQVEVKGANWQHPHGPWSNITGKERHPAVQVSWNDAVAYVQWVDKRLPTEEEWEKAARGTDGRTWPWGSTWVNGISNTAEAGVGDITPVGHYSPGADSPYGLADMGGNVSQWTADWYSAYPGSTYQVDLYGEKCRVIRGGTWTNSRGVARCASRNWGRPFGRFDHVGFRLAE